MQSSKNRDDQRYGGRCPQSAVMRRQPGERDGRTGGRVPRSQPARRRPSPPRRSRGIRPRRAPRHRPASRSLYSALNRGAEKASRAFRNRPLRSSLREGAGLASSLFEDQRSSSSVAGLSGVSSWFQTTCFARCADVWELRWHDDPERPRRKCTKQRGVTFEEHAEVVRNSSGGTPFRQQGHDCVSAAVTTNRGREIGQHADLL